MYPQLMFRAKIRKQYHNFHLRIFIFAAVNNQRILHKCTCRRVFEMLIVFTNLPRIDRYEHHQHIKRETEETNIT